MTGHRTFRQRQWLCVLVVAATSWGLASCGTSDPGSVTLIAYDSFPDKDTALNEALAEFTKESGIDVTLVRAGDTGSMVSKAVLTSGNPEGDVIFGVDNTFLSAAVNGKVFNGDPVAVDYGDVCINYDKEWFEANDLKPPTTMAQLATPAYRDLLVVENPTTSSPGLAFLLASIATFGEDGWQQYWTDLRANGVSVVDSWDLAYYESFTRAGGDRPLVVSYGSSPPAEVIFADPPRTDSPTAVLVDSCFRQTEYVGTLRGSDNVDGANKLVAFLTSERFQQELPLTLFVYPALKSVALPPEFVQFSVIPDAPLTVDPSQIELNRERWQDEWTTIVLR